MIWWHWPEAGDQATGNVDEICEKMAANKENIKNLPQNHGGVESTPLVTPVNRSPNKYGNNQFTNGVSGVPYPLRYMTAKALLESGHTYDEVCLITGLSRQLVADVATGRKQVNLNVVEAMKKAEARGVTKLINRTMETIDNEWGRLTKKASFSQMTVGLGILVDKRELLEGRPTQRSEFVGKSDEALDARMAELQAQLVAWESGKVVNATAVTVENL